MCVMGRGRNGLILQGNKIKKKYDTQNTLNQEDRIRPFFPSVPITNTVVETARQLTPQDLVSLLLPDNQPK